MKKKIEKRKRKNEVPRVPDEREEVTCDESFSFLLHIVNIAAGGVAAA